MKLWLDPSRKQDFAFVSHAHADHSARHRKILCTPPTSRILKHRLGVEAQVPMDYGESLELADGTVSLHPSGHIFGAAQILVERAGERLLYSGDFKLKPSRTAEPCRAVSCDHLIMECTYGRPQYRFPDRKEVEENLIDCISGLLDRGEVPVVLAYALGRAQEMTCLLTARGFSVAMERRVFETSEIYREMGVDLGPFESFDPAAIEGRVLIFPPHLWKAPVVREIPRKKTIAVTGWAVDGRQRSWYRSDFSFPLSDHADFDDLIRFVEMTRPRHVYLVHGFTDFAEHLSDLDVSVRLLS
jgi:Cft2 family RNA processing exonuclease